jgi:hypothetical protein
VRTVAPGGAPFSTFHPWWCAKEPADFFREDTKGETIVDELVKRLSEGDHPVIASRAESVVELKESIERGYVLIKFTETRGGT